MATDLWPPMTSSWPCRHSEWPVHNNQTRLHRSDSTAWGSGWGTYRKSGATSGGPTRTRCSAALPPRGRSGLGAPESWCVACWSDPLEQQKRSIGAMAQCPEMIRSKPFWTSRTRGLTVFQKEEKASSHSCAGGILPKPDSHSMEHRPSNPRHCGKPRDGSARDVRSEPHRNRQFGNPRCRKDCHLWEAQAG